MEATTFKKGKSTFTKRIAVMIQQLFAKSAGLRDQMTEHTIAANANDV